MVKLGYRIALALVGAVVLTFIAIGFFKGTPNEGAIGTIFVVSWAITELLVEGAAWLCRKFFGGGNQ